MSNKQFLIMVGIVIGFGIAALVLITAGFALFVYSDQSAENTAAVSPVLATPVVFEPAAAVLPTATPVPAITVLPGTDLQFFAPPEEEAVDPSVQNLVPETTGQPTEESLQRHLWLAIGTLSIMLVLVLGLLSARYWPAFVLIYQNAAGIKQTAMIYWENVCGWSPWRKKDPSAKPKDKVAKKAAPVAKPVRPSKKLGPGATPTKKSVVPPVTVAPTVAPAVASDPAPVDSATPVAPATASAATPVATATAKPVGDFMLTFGFDEGGA